MPYQSRAHFEIADFLFRKAKMSGRNTDELMQLWSAFSQNAPFADHAELYGSIDSITLADIPWQAFEVTYTGPRPGGDVPPWMDRVYTVWYRCPRDVLHAQLGNPDFAEEMDHTPKQVYHGAERVYRDFMSGDWAWKQVVADREYADDPQFRKFRRQLFHTSLHTILESLKPGMATPEVVRYADGHYRRTIYGFGPYIADYPEQALLACIVQGWCPKCDAHRDHLDGEGVQRSHSVTDPLLDALSLRALWDDYGIVGDLLPFTVAFPRADIHEMLSPDLLHQVIKGTFKDHLVAWVEEYLVLTYGKAQAAVILADIDRRIAAVPHFPGLRRFPEGRGFKQWTGDDSKALMKVYLPAIKGYVPPQMVQCLSAFLEFCYLVRRDTITTCTMAQIKDALARFHRDRVIFEEVGVCLDGFSLPRQHSLKHYPALIQMFGALNGLCSSITESKHIKAVKEPYQRSNRFEALGQMLLTNQRLDKLAAARVDFTARGMLHGSYHPMPPIPEEDVWAGLDLEGPYDMDPEELAEQQAALDEDDDGGPVDDVIGKVVLAKRKLRGYPRDCYELAAHIGVPSLPELIRRFLYVQQYNGPVELGENIDLALCPAAPRRISVFPSAVAYFYAPSDVCGVKGMRKERIRSVASWRGGPARRDCVFILDDDTQPGFRGLLAARVLLLFSFRGMDDVEYPCVLVSWFTTTSDHPCEETGMWTVEPEMDEYGHCTVSVVHLDCILRAAHLIGIAGHDPIPHRLKHTDSLDAFTSFFVNKYADHHAHEIAF
ncbi:hypothetical protein BD311DRAFT_782809 [Dichomitus squalens]|uniref:Uncharacterized protein n=1 Tax=Dichomitus squalens TaxID=114155 RepID=A0A4V2JYM2_9APHY|nr:hypothetical protein BD311DRAFT_782809 [Dichomitus squalens]